MNENKLKHLFHFFIFFAVIVSVMSGISVSAKSQKVSLNTQDMSAGEAFSVNNMFPGDAEEKEFTVKVKHKEPISLYYRADIREGYEKLSRVMMIRVYLPEKDLLLYDGLMIDMPNSLEYTVGAKEDSVLYRITVYLNTSVGNEYQNKALVSDFRWWYTEEETWSGPIWGGGGNGPREETEEAPDPVPDDKPEEPNPDEPKSEVNIKIVAEVVFDGEYPRGDGFSFILTDENGNEVQTVNNRDGHIEFDSLKFEGEGEYIFYISQIAGSDSGIQYDSSVYKVKITVTKEEDIYRATVTYEKEGNIYSSLPRFLNVSRGKEYLNPEPTNPKTGDSTNISLYITLFAGSVTAVIILLILFIIKRKKENNP